jgi:glycosyltransferase involved in cell wall biosynthesis
MPDSKIRVLYVVENTTFGGGERGFGQLSSAINRNRFHPIIAAHSGGRLEDMAQKQGVRFYPLDMNRKFNLKTIAKISKIINENRINIVHSMGSRADFFARIACRNILFAKVICTVAMLVEGYDVNGLRKAVYKFADWYSSRFVSHYITVSQALKQKLIQEREIPEERISVIYNGVELDRFNPERFNSNGLRKSLGIKEDYTIVGSIGRLVYQKGFLYLIEAARILHQKNYKIRLVIVGQGPEENKLKHMAETSGIIDVCTFVGQRFDIPQLLSDFDIFALPSVLEGLPRVVIEAMAMGKPIVAADIDGVREELTHNRTGIIVPPKNPVALAEAIMSLINDKRRGIQLGSEARRSAERRFDLKQTVSNIERLYESILL